MWWDPPSTSHICECGVQRCGAVTEDSEQSISSFVSLLTSSCHTRWGGEQGDKYNYYTSSQFFIDFFFFYVELAKLFAAAAMSFQCQQRFLVWSLTLSYVICTILYPLNERNDLGQKSIISGPAAFNVTSSPLNCRSFYGGFTNEQLRLIET